MGGRRASRRLAGNEREYIQQVLRARLKLTSTDEFADGWRRLEEDGKVTLVGKEIAVTPEGMLVVDRLLPTFFEPEHLGSRYT